MDGSLIKQNPKPDGGKPGGVANEDNEESEQQQQKIKNQDGRGAANRKTESWKRKNEWA